MDIAEKLFFLDYKSGLGYCGDDEEFYMDILRSYLEENVLAVLNDLYLKSDWRSYKVKIHALKSSSRYIGANNISEKARLLELAAKDNDITYINVNHYKFIWQYEVLLKRINSIFINGDCHEDVANIGQLHVLVVDDNELSAQAVAGPLAQYYHVTTCHSGEEALEKLKLMTPEIILLDVFMPPGMDGYTFMNELKKKERLSTIPIIVMTADDNVDNEVRGFEEGAADFISKTSSVSVISARINRIVELQYLRRFLMSEIKKQTQEEKEKRQNAEKLSDEIILALTGSIEAKDKYTKGHSDRVAKYAVMIAKELGYDEEMLQKVKYAGLLHDIGNIGIPDVILNKPAPLTMEEYAVVKGHTMIGARILESVTSIPEIAVAARYHHEHYDGSGYPDGLVGLHIPEIARLIGVASAYDAMTSHRGYRGELDQNVVKHEILKGLGTQFDPLFGQTMVELINRDTAFILREDGNDIPSKWEEAGQYIGPMEIICDY